MACNTSALQAFALQGSREDSNIPVRVREARGVVLGDLLASTEPLNITSAVTLWFGVATDVLQAFAPSEGMSMLLPSVAPNYSSIELLYDGIYLVGYLTLGAQPNLIAGDNWTLKVVYTPKDSISSSSYSIIFLTSGAIDPSSDLDSANALLAPTIALLRFRTGDSTFDIWKLFHWLYVSYYWMLLYNFGEIAPTTYGSAPQLRGSYFTAFGSPNFSDPIQYPATNNIFINDTLFGNYSDYLRNTLLPISARFSGYPSIPPFLPINESNRLEPISISFLTTYSCTETQLKGWVSVIISVLVADYALITGAYTFIVWISGPFKKDTPAGELLANQANGSGR
jgi:hypothetical protein